MHKLFEHLITLEKKLHHYSNRDNLEFLENVLHQAFLEFCRSGVSADKTETLLALTQANNLLEIHSENFQCAQIDANTVLITYLSFQLDNGIRIKQTLRSSIWIKNQHNQWQLRFHQGTLSSL
ncbi:MULTISPECIES: nuclear transport factor 2 family protein [Providencia]|nr:DUF4440 domain-containing protein [Providencia stuartii]